MDNQTQNNNPMTNNTSSPAPATVTPEANQPAQPTNVKKTKVKTILISIIAVILIISICCASTIILAAFGRGRSNPISSFAAFVATENIPLLKDFSMNEYEMMAMAINNYSKATLVESELKQNLIFNGATRNNSSFENKINVNFTSKTTVKTDADKDIESSSSFYGEANLGITNFNIKEDDLVFNGVTINEGDSYKNFILFNKDSQTINYVLSMLDQKQGEILRKYIGKYIDVTKFSEDPNQLYSTINPFGGPTLTPVSSTNNSTKALNDLSKEIEPELVEYMSKNILDFEKYLDLKFANREIVEGKQAIVIEFKGIKPSKFADTVYEFAEGLPGFVADNQSKFDKYCDAVNESQKDQYNQIYDECNINKSTTQKGVDDFKKGISKEKITKSLEDILKFNNLNGTKFYLDPVTGDFVKVIVKYEMDLVNNNVDCGNADFKWVTKCALKESKDGFLSFEARNVIFTIENRIIKLDKNFDVKAPSDAVELKTITDELNKYQEEKRKLEEKERVEWLKDLYGDEYDKYYDENGNRESTSMYEYYDI